ncbi:hypothetical protein MYAM1_001822 [Malassezia yamatoensis]|uniref:BAH domain-containing protein n=1 Tax=Malassezia yamatoensis TaxID=253288 RepID=A0AAJ6CH92_9BASI|nr:hypothetical protein MYAM1_001822 [Malassezia yamatoensis]
MEESLGLCVGSGEEVCARSVFDGSNGSENGWVRCRARDTEGMHRMFAHIVHFLRDVELGSVESDVKGDDPLRVLSDPLEECPSRNDNPEYYERPALFEQDMLQLFHNARTWYGLGTQGYKEMTTLQRLYQELTPSKASMQDESKAMQLKGRTNDIELVDWRQKHARLASSFASSSYGPGKEPASVYDADTLLPSAWFKGREYHIGDWVHLMNPVDPSRPIIGQIFRFHKQRKIPGTFLTACWYYRPEQTNHTASRTFYENEVLKTGVFGEHVLEDIIEEVLVLFHTKYTKARPKAAYSTPGAPVYLVESKYDVHKSEFQRIQSWASCVPAEVRSKITPMDIFTLPTTLPERKPSLLTSNVRGIGFGELLDFAKEEEDPHEYRDLFDTGVKDQSSPPPETRPTAAPIRPPVSELSAAHPERLRTYAAFHVVASEVARRMSADSYLALQNAITQNPDMTADDLNQLKTAFDIPEGLLTRLRDAARSAGVLEQVTHFDLPKVPSLAPVLAAQHSEALFAPLPNETANHFRHDPHGQTLWYAAPPLDGWRASVAVQDGTTSVPLPSLSYLYNTVKK